MRKLKILILSLILILAPSISLCATGHINGCTNTSFDTNCCTKTFKITAQSGYTVTDVIVNGVSQGAISSYTFSNISGPQTLKVITTANGGNTTGGTSGGTSTGGSTSSGGPYTIRFNSNRGEGTMADQTYSAGVTQTLPINTFTRTGYFFVGWSNTASGKEIYTDGDYYIATKNETLYAVWEKSMRLWVIDEELNDENGDALPNLELGLNFVQPDTYMELSYTAHYITYYFNDKEVASYKATCNSWGSLTGGKSTVSYCYPIEGDELWMRAYVNTEGETFHGYNGSCDCDNDDDNNCPDGVTSAFIYYYDYDPDVSSGGAQKVEIVNSSSDPLYVYNKDNATWN